MSNGSLRIQGGAPLRGTVRVGGAKNAALPIMAAALLTRDTCAIRNVPRIEDIATLAELLRALGASVEFPDPHTVVINASQLTTTRAPAEFVAKMRASFLVMGPLVARFGQAEAGHPGGCELGIRPVNVDVEGLRAMGATVNSDDATYRVDCPHLQGARMYLDYPSHTGTENLLMAACVAEGETVIKHASMEPEVTDLAGFLVALGARIRGAGTSTIVVEGVPTLHGAEYSVMPDRLTAGTFAVAGLITRGDVMAEGIIPEHLDPVIFKLGKIGALVELEEDRMRCAWKGPLRPVDIQAIHYPGFPTDLQAVFAATLTQAEGISSIHERVFENRLTYAEQLNTMGAHITVGAQTAYINGPTPLHGARVRARDIRAGAALVLAGLAAEGETVMDDAQHVGRGYEDLVDVLRQLGGQISHDR
ncbi:MAG: UDP-N-acetylglucosamine 1-carboxyvinyltransferase [Chloroflexi bacterium]|nr:UDP-N-acetylglucosamine 1-carboxyvinyltransferase [Chloroflexota bacterium]